MLLLLQIGPTLNSYKLIYLADTHVSKKASTALASWVAAGGTLLATAGAGMFDELNKTNTVMSKLLGITGHGTVEPSEVQFIKQDLINATALGTVSWVVNTTTTATATATAIKGTADIEMQDDMHAKKQQQQQQQQEEEERSWIASSGGPVNCDPKASPPQLCPGPPGKPGVPCPHCGKAACPCPSGPSPAPSPPPPPAPHPPPPAPHPPPPAPPPPAPPHPPPPPSPSPPGPPLPPPGPTPGPGQNASAAAVAVRHIFTPAATSSVIASYDDATSSPAAVRTTSGKGQALYYSFYPGLSYFLPAMPVRPADRGALDSSYTHFIPSAFNADILALIKNVAQAAGAQPQVTCSNPLVHGKPVVSKTGKKTGFWSTLYEKVHFTQDRLVTQTHS